LDVDSAKSVRLLRRDGTNLFEDHPIEVGELWDVSCTSRDPVIPPHVEDVLVKSGKSVAVVPSLKQAIIDLVDPWTGDVRGIFEGQLQTTRHGKGYIGHERPLPSCSTGFWRSDVELRRGQSTGGERYWFPEGGFISSVKYVGMEDAVDVIPHGSLVRFSLARWLAFVDTPERCYLQLSGWYL
jgi:hypothetical protein